MNPQSSASSNSSNSLIDSVNCVQSIVAVHAESSRAHVAADRLYQIAALTAGIFLLATLL